MTDTVEIPVSEYRCLLVDAKAWRVLRESPRLGEVLSALLDVPTIRDMRGIVPIPPIDPKRVQYDRPPLSAEQIRMKAALSWADFEGRSITDDNAREAAA